MPDPNRQLIPINFFLHNTVADNANYITPDELVRHAINNRHSRTFDHLALFSMHLARMGRRTGVAGDPHGAAFTNDFVRNHLWKNGGWQSESLNEGPVERAFETTIQAEGVDTVHKCVTNYLYMMTLMGLRRYAQIINTNIDEWIGPGLFIAFDRYAADRTSGGQLRESELMAMIKADELHKLMGTTESYLDTIASLIAAKYLELGGMHRVTNTAVMDASGESLASSPSSAPSDSQSPSATWSDEDAEDAAGVIRRLQETEAQIRNTRNVRELKSLYKNTCMLCGKKTIIGVFPTKHYSEAAHIRPVGQPHNGPDRKDNMIVLCLEHHLQFDRGLLRLRKTRSGFRVVSKIPGDPLHSSDIILQEPHALSEDCVIWHFNFWNSR